MVINVENWIQRFHGIILGLAIGAILFGCAAPQAANQRAIAEWQTEGHHIYSEKDGKKYFVRCTNGEKYVGYWVPETSQYQLYGPMDVCTGEEE